MEATLLTFIFAFHTPRKYHLVPYQNTTSAGGILVFSQYARAK